MSEKSAPTFKAPRSIPEIQSEYQQLCTKAGHLQYQAFCHEKDLAIVNDELRSLNLEAAAAQQAANEAAAKAEAEKAKAKEEPPVETPKPQLKSV